MPRLHRTRIIVSADFGSGTEAAAGEPMIRAFRAADTEAVVALWRSCGLIRPWNDPHRDIERKLEVQQELFLVAVVSNAIVGSIMAGYEGHRGWINYLAVDPAFRRQGVATALVARVEQVLTAMGCPKINLQIRRDNHDVADFYEALGYLADDVLSMGKRLIADHDADEA